MIAERMLEIRDDAGAEAILPFYYGGSNGLLTQDTNDAQLFRGVRHLTAGAHGLCGADRRGQRRRSTARWPASPTRTTSHARLIVLWGVNPSASGIHLVPFLKDARNRGATLVVIDPRATSLAQAGGSAPCAAARHRPAARARAAPVPVRARPR